MPTNPIEPVETPTRTARTAKAVARFTGRHTEAVTLATGILMGSALTLIASLVQ